MPLNAFLKFEGGNPTIEGASVKEGHEGEIEILSYSFGVSLSGTRQTSTGGGGSWYPNVQDMVVTFVNEKAAPNLFISSVTANHFDSVTLYVRRGGGTDTVTFLEVKMSDVIISSYQASASTGMDEPMDSMSLNFAEIEYTYRPQNADGSAGGDIVQAYNIAKDSR